MENINIKLAQSLKELRVEKELTQAELAKDLSISGSRVSQFEKGALPQLDMLMKLAIYFNVSIDRLVFGTTNVDKERREGPIRWIFDPQSDDKDYLKIVKTGNELFEAMVIKKQDADQVLNIFQKKLNWTYLNSAFSMAVRSGAFRLTGVEQDETLEQQIVSDFEDIGIKQVIVAKVPKDGHGYIDGTIIRAEIVSYLAATKALPASLNAQNIGIGWGYTLLRMAEQSGKIQENLKTANWYPLFTLHNSHMKSRGYDPSNICSIFWNSHPTTKFIPIDTQAEVTYPLLDTVFLSVNGGERKSKSGNQTTERYTSVPLDYHFQEIFATHQKYIETYRLGGEIAGILFSQDGGKAIGEADTSRFRSGITLENLKRMAPTGSFWIVATRAYKAEAVFWALQNRLANCLVIDNDIANYLIQRKQKERNRLRTK